MFDLLDRGTLLVDGDAPAASLSQAVLRTAAEDPEVLAVKHVIGAAPAAAEVEALCRAAAAGKHVVVVADAGGPRTGAPTDWMRLEAAGAHVRLADLHRCLGGSALSLSLLVRRGPGPLLHSYGCAVALGEAGDASAMATADGEAVRRIADCFNRLTGGGAAGAVPPLPAGLVSSPAG